MVVCRLKKLEILQTVPVFFPKFTTVVNLGLGLCFLMCIRTLLK